MMEKKKRLAVQYTVIAASLWGTIGVFVRALSAYGLTSLQLTVMRLLISAVLIGCYLGMKDREKFRIRWKDIGWFFVTGVLCILFFNVCYAITIEKSSMSTAAVLLYTSPVIVTLVSIPVFGEMLTKRKCIAILLAVTGCALVSGIMHGNNADFSGDVLLWGMGAAVGYAMYSVIARILLRRYQAITLLFYTFVTASVTGVFICRIDQAIDIILLHKDAGLILFISALVCNTLPYFFYTNALKNMEASQVSILASIEPVVATIIGIVFFGEPITIYGIVGILCVLSSIVVLNSSKQNGGILI